MLDNKIECELFGWLGRWCGSVAQRATSWVHHWQDNLVVFQGDVLADGSDAQKVRRWNRRREAEARLGAAEAASARGEAGAAHALAAAEAALDEALQEELDDGEGFEQVQHLALCSTISLVRVIEVDSHSCILFA